MDKITLVTDVLIAGAGPVGMVLANILKRNGLSVTLIDKRATKPQWPRGIAINQASLDIFATLGLKSIANLGLKVSKTELYCNQKVIGQLNFDNSILEAPYYFHLSQNEVEKELESALLALHLDIKKEFELVDYQQKETWVHSTIQTNNEKITIQSKILIGCDGGNSKVREIMGCGINQRYYGPSFILADVLINNFHQNNTKYIFTKNGYLMIVPLPHNQFRLIFSVLTSEIDNDTDYLNKESIQELLDQRSNLKIKIEKLIWATKAPYGHRLSNLAYKDNVVLAGDALHQFSPVGGTNMNVGLQDAYSLAWRLLDRTRDLHCHLQEYSLERKKVIHKQQEITEWMTALITRSKQYISKNKKINFNELSLFLTGLGCDKKMLHLQNFLSYSKLKNNLILIREAFAKAHYVLLTQGTLSSALEVNIKKIIQINQSINWINISSNKPFEFYFCRPDAIVLCSGNSKDFQQILNAIGAIND